MKLSELNDMLGARNKLGHEDARLRTRNIYLETYLICLKALLDFESLIQSQAAKLLEVHRGTISRAIAKGKLESNGESGRKCLISGKALLEYYESRETAILSRMVRQSKN